MKDVNILTSNGIDVNHGLELLGDMETYDSIITDFYDGYLDRMKKIDNFKNNSDMENYAIEVHSLKSDSKYLGFMTLADIAYKHEMASKANNIDEVNNSYNELVTEANRIFEVVSKYLGNNVSINPIPQVEPITESVPEIVEETVQVVTPSTVENSKYAIVVADDSNIIREFVNDVFKDEYQILMASNGEEVINIVNSNKDIIKALLLDLNMPGVNGFGVLDYFKENNLFGSIPISIISGADDKESIDRAFTYPIIDMLNKPFSKESVKQVVEKTINVGGIM